MEPAYPTERLFQVIVIDIDALIERLRKAGATWFSNELQRDLETLIAYLEQVEELARK